jgi:hypothetical protein
MGHETVKEAVTWKSVFEMNTGETAILEWSRMHFETSLNIDIQT